MDSAHQIIVAAEVIGSGSEQSMLLPMIDKSEPVRESDTLITADAGYHSDANIAALHERGIPAMIADTQMRQRDERIDNAHHKAQDDPLYDKSAVKTVRFFRPEVFTFNGDNTATCPAGKTLTGNGSIYGQRGHRFQRYEARSQDCAACHLRALRVAGEAACAGRTPGLAARIDGSQAFRVQSGGFKDAKPTPCKFDRAVDVQRTSPILARGVKTQSR